jgi:hypothetical protein
MAKTANIIKVQDVLDFIGIAPVLNYSPEGANVRTEIPVYEIFTRHPEMIRFAIIAGLGGKLGNISKSGLSKQLDRPATDADLASARKGIVKTWLEDGTWNMRGGGERDSLVSFMWDAYFAEKGLITEAAKKQERKRIGELVRKRYGEKESASFGRYLDAVADTLQAAGRGDAAELRQRLGEKYTSLAKELRDATTSASASIDASELEGMLG